MRWRSVWVSKRKRKKGVSLVLEYYDDAGYRRGEKCGWLTKGRIPQTVLDLRRRREIELNSGLLGRPAAPSLSEFKRDHLQLLASTAQPATVAVHREALTAMETFFGDVKLDAITRAEAEKFCIWRIGNTRSKIERRGKERIEVRRTIQPATVNKTSRTARAIFAAAIQRGHLAANPFDSISFLREPERVLRILDADEIRKLLDAAPTVQWRAFISLAATTGLRSGEIAALEWEDVDFEAGLVIVRSKSWHRTKTGKVQRVPLSPESSALLLGIQAGRTGGPVFLTAAGTRFRWNLPRAF